MGLLSNPFTDEKRRFPFCPEMGLPFSPFTDAKRLFACRDFIHPFPGVCVCAIARKGIYFTIGGDFLPMKHRFNKHYTRDEARALLPQIRQWLERLTQLAPAPGTP